MKKLAILAGLLILLGAAPAPVFADTEPFGRSCMVVVCSSLPFDFVTDVLTLEGTRIGTRLVVPETCGPIMTLGEPTRLIAGDYIVRNSLPMHPSAYMEVRQSITEKSTQECTQAGEEGESYLLIEVN